MKKKDDNITQLALNIKKDKAYRLKILAQLRTEKKGKRVYYANIIRNAIDGVLKYNKDEIDEYIANMES